MHPPLTTQTTCLPPPFRSTRPTPHPTAPPHPPPWHACARAHLVDDGPDLLLRLAGRDLQLQRPVVVLQAAGRQVLLEPGVFLQEGVGVGGRAGGVKGLRKRAAQHAVLQWLAARALGLQLSAQGIPMHEKPGALARSRRVLPCFSPPCPPTPRPLAAPTPAQVWSPQPPRLLERPHASWLAWICLMVSRCRGLATRMRRMRSRQLSLMVALGGNS